jgi:hypothetical protein
MFLERYEYTKSKIFGQFYFYSDGPKGRIQKIVRYRHFGRFNGFHYFNVGFGDIDPKSGKVNDLIVTDNKDREKVLATIAATAMEFTHTTRKCRLIVRGSTPARTRLYQMKIAAYHPEISILFDIQGYSGAQWERFKTGKNYLSFQFERINFKS